MRLKFSTLSSVMMALFLMLLANPANAQESKVKSIFIMKFVENVAWPDKKEAFVIGIVGGAEIKSELESRLAVKNPLNLVVKDVTSENAGTCDVVFVASDKDSQFSKVKEATNAKKVLLITESDLASKGAGISFFTENNKMRFAINKSSIESRGLKISSTLLNLAKIV